MNHLPCAAQVQEPCQAHLKQSSSLFAAHLPGWMDIVSTVWASLPGCPCCPGPSPPCCPPCCPPGNPRAAPWGPPRGSRRAAPPGWPPPSASRPGPGSPRRWTRSRSSAPSPPSSTLENYRLQLHGALLLQLPVKTGTTFCKSSFKLIAYNANSFVLANYYCGNFFAAHPICWPTFVSQHWSSKNWQTSQGFQSV